MEYPNNKDGKYQDMRNQGYSGGGQYPPQVGYPPSQGGYYPQPGYPPQQNPYGNQMEGAPGAPPPNPGMGGNYNYRSYTQTISAAPVPAGGRAAGGASGGKSYSFLDPIIPTEKKESYATSLLQAQNTKITEVYKKLYIGKIPTNVKDTLIERLLKACGTVEYWKRAINASNQPRSFGYCEFEEVEGAVVCLKSMNQLKVGENSLIVSLS